jgi:hypothetical protein
VLQAVTTQVVDIAEAQLSIVQNQLVILQESSADTVTKAAAVVKFARDVIVAWIVL